MIATPPPDLQAFSVATGSTDGPFNAAVAGLTAFSYDATAMMMDHVNRSNALRDEATTRTDALSELANTLAGEDLSVRYTVPYTESAITMNDAVNVTEAALKTVDPVNPLLLDPNLPLQDFVEQVWGPIETFTSSVGTIDVPDFTPGVSPVAPDKPTVTDLVINDMPDMTIQAMGDLLPLNIPAMDTILLPVFTSGEPEFQGSLDTVPLNWTVRTSPYAQLGTIAEYTDMVRTMFAGKTGIPPEVEAAMWARAAEREDTVLAKDISQARVEFASRGFTMPPGMLAAQITALTEEASIKKRGLSRDVAIKVADSVLENLRFACTQTIAAAALEKDLWTLLTQQELEAAKFDVESHIQFVNAQISLFNAEQQAYAVKAQIFKTRLDAELSKVTIFKERIEAEALKGQLNESIVKAYLGRVQAMSAQADAYKAYVTGVQAKAEIQATKIRAYQAEVEAYSAEYTGMRVAVEAYSARVQAEGHKAGIIQAEAQAYASYLQAKGTEYQGKLQQNEFRKLNNEKLVQVRTVALESERTRLADQRVEVDGSIDLLKKSIMERELAHQEHETDVRAAIAAKEYDIRTQLLNYEAWVKQAQWNQEMRLKQNEMLVEISKGIAQSSATMAAGAMAGLSVGASVSATASAGSMAVSSKSTSKALTNAVNSPGATGAAVPVWSLADQF